MSIRLTTEQENFVQSKIQTGKYQSTQEVLEIALRLLDEYDRAEAEWRENVRAKIEEAVMVSEHTPPLDGETFINQILDRFNQVRQTKI
ncbi:MAG TPA: type II toxin-antitoxin system ParD family antitoxin [Allocoleopsis sp.]